MLVRTFVFGLACVCCIYEGNAQENQTAVAVEDSIYKLVDEMPRFPGCEHQVDLSNDEKFQCAQAKMLQYMYNNVRYPKEAVDAKIQGRVVVQFVVEKDGTLTNFECVRNLSHGLCEEAMRTIATMNDLPEKWTPGKHNGEPKRVRFILPVSFKL